MEGQLFLLREGGNLQEGRLRRDRKEVVDEVDEVEVIEDRLFLKSQISLLTV